MVAQSDAVHTMAKELEVTGKSGQGKMVASILGWRLH
jgi:hypothetical protein